MLSLPPWIGMHPMVVHFPLVLLMMVPVFLALALYRKEPTGPFAVTAWILLALGTVAAFVATMSGEAAESLVIASDQVRQAIERHSDLGEYARDVAAMEFLLLSVLLGWTLYLKRPIERRWLTGLMFVVFLVSMVGALLVAMTGHVGAYLVHGLGVTNTASFLPQLH
jgi:uncharacterized membrane protein